MTLGNTKALFKCTRERLGVPQYWIAEKIGIREVTCRHWESTATERKPSAEGLAYLSKLESDFNEKIDSLVLEYRNNFALKDVVVVYYYPTQEIFEKINPGTTSWFGYENAITREVKAQLERDGYDVIVEYKL